MRDRVPGRVNRSAAVLTVVCTAAAVPVNAAADVVPAAADSSTCGASAATVGTDGRRISSAECAKKQTCLLHSLPSRHIIVRYLSGQQQSHYMNETTPTNQINCVLVSNVNKAEFLQNIIRSNSHAMKDWFNSNGRADDATL